MTDLSQRKCIPCRGGVPPLKGRALTDLGAELGHEWRVVDEHHLEKHFKFKDFAGALAFANRAGAVAERENHHPDLLVRWGEVVVTVWTHKIDGLTESDFVLAAKIEADHQEPRPQSGK